MRQTTQDLRKLPIEAQDDAFAGRVLNRCPDCGVREYDGALYCSNCGASLLGPGETVVVKVAGEGDRDTGELELLRGDAGAIIDAKTVTFVIGNAGRRVKLGLEREIRIGRADPDGDKELELNLVNDKAAENGVSRLHAAIRASEWGVVLVDLDSTNGTLLNNCRLPKELPYPLHNGDKIRFGRLLVQVFFE